MGGINHQKWVVYCCYTHITVEKPMIDLQLIASTTQHLPAVQLLACFAAVRPSFQPRSFPAVGLADGFRLWPPNCGEFEETRGVKDDWLVV